MICALLNQASLFVKQNMSFFGYLMIFFGERDFFAYHIKLGNRLLGVGHVTLKAVKSLRGYDSLRLIT